LMIITFLIVYCLFYVIFLLLLINVFSSYVIDDLYQDQVMNCVLYLCELLMDQPYIILLGRLVLVLNLV